MKIRYAPKLFAEFVGFARENRAYWIIPLIVILGITALGIVAGDAVAPVLYTMF